MNIHKRTRLTLLDRQEIWQLYQTRLWKVAHLAGHFQVSRPTIYDVLKRARLQEFTPRNWGVGLWNDRPDAGIAYIVEYSAPVPEPEIYAMLLAGLGIIGFAGRRLGKS